MIILIRHVWSLYLVISLMICRCRSFYTEAPRFHVGNQPEVGTDNYYGNLKRTYKRISYVLNLTCDERQCVLGATHGEALCLYSL